MKRSAGSGELINPPRNGGVFFHGGAWCGLMRASMIRGFFAAEMLSPDTSSRAMHVGGGIGPGESDPKEVGQRSSSEFAVINNHQQGERVPRGARCEGIGQALDGWLDVLRMRLESRAGDGDDSWQAESGPRESVGQGEFAGNLRGKLSSLGADGGDDQFGTFVERGAAVVECVDRCRRLKVKVARPVDSLKQMLE